jgi:ATP/maltotriose-dependent transcriptional regulator MalT
MSGSLESSIALYEAAVDEARRAEAPLEELRFAVLLANALIDAGGTDAAQEVLARVIRIAQDSGDPVTSARLYWSQSRLHWMRHEPTLASRYARLALDILERTENDAYVAMAYHLLAHAEVESGNADEAVRLLEQGRERFGRELLQREDAKFAIVEARALMALGKNRDAARSAARALELLDAMGPGDRGRAYIALAEVFAAAGDEDRPKMLLGQALDLLVEYSSKLALEAARPLADLLEAEGDTAGALAVLKRATDAGVAAPARVS